mmetsp:Transcript_6865/g.14318  ORF Transcript_6865/g.14318 Transcript_6865/m.14318 type:complete len:85 (-) Transcript_6865:524-778(-)
MFIVLENITTFINKPVIFSEQSKNLIGFVTRFTLHVRVKSRSCIITYCLVYFTPFDEENETTKKRLKSRSKNWLFKKSIKTNHP